MSNVNRPRRGLLDGMADIVSDLWGTPVVADVPAQPLTSAETPVEAPFEGAAEAPAAQADEPIHTVKPALPPFVQLWKTADEPIDWTEALASPTPTDGLTDPDKWTLYHQQAASVLHGDTVAYLTVLKAANPMADLMPYVGSLDVSPRSADHLRAVFSVRPDLMDEEAPRYLCGMALRIARDLFAVLPVTQVTVEAHQGDVLPLTVDFERRELNKVRFSFIDPVEFVEACGGKFA